MAMYGEISKLNILSRYLFISSFVSMTMYAGRKMDNLMWLRMAGYIYYISSIYMFISSLVSLTKYAGRKLKNLVWLHMAGELMSIFIFGYALRSQLWLRIARYLNYFVDKILQG